MIITGHMAFFSPLLKQPKDSTLAFSQLQNPAVTTQFSSCLVSDFDSDSYLSILKCFGQGTP